MYLSNTHLETEQRNQRMAMSDFHFPNICVHGGDGVGMFEITRIVVTNVLHLEPVYFK